MRWPFVLILFSCLLIPSCSSPPFTQEECETLIHRVDQLTLAPLTPVQRDQLAPLLEDHHGALTACVEGKSWSREGMDCTLEAEDREDLARCLKVNREFLRDSPSVPCA